MDESVIIHRQPADWLDQSILAPFVGGYYEHLAVGRYAAHTKRVYLYCVAHFARWLTEEGIDLQRITEAITERYVLGHLPHCKCPAPVRRLVHENRAALRHLVQVLRADGVAPPSPSSVSFLEDELGRFDHYLDHVCGCARNTRRQRRRIVGGFLAARFGDRAISPSDIRADEVRIYVLGKTEPKWSPGTIGVVAGSLGSYFRFRRMCGDDVGQLLNAIPRVAHWRLTGLPEVFNDAQLEQIWRSFDASFPSAYRAYAMVRCLADLGLRADEVVRLTLDDVNWASGTVTLATSKSRRADILPLPVETGRAIAAYLQKERPQTTGRTIFVRHVAPYDKPIGKGTVVQAVVAAYRRCGWSHNGVHIFRRTVASRLLRAGVPLKDIADILRHRDLNTSMIYTKIDLPRVAAVAMPWPGSAP